MNASTVSSYSKIEWSEIYKKSDGTDSVTFKGIDSKPQFMISNVGVHRFRLHTLSDYVGCTDQYYDLSFNIDRSDFKIVNDLNEVCVNQKIHFNLKDTLNIKPHKYHWFFGDGDEDSVNINTNHTFNRVFETGSVRVIFAVENSCHNFDSVHITVRQVMAAFDRGNQDALIKGCSPFQVTFLNKSVGALSYNWDFGDGTTDNSDSPTHIFYQQDSVFKIRLAIQGSLCSDDTQKTIKVMKSPSLRSNYVNTICQDSLLQLHLTTTAGTVVTGWNSNP
jgi:PKD repeat protein